MPSAHTTLEAPLNVGVEPGSVKRSRGVARRAMLGLVALLALGAAAAPRAVAAEPYVLHADIDYDLGSPVSPAPTIGSTCSCRAGRP